MRLNVLYDWSNLVFLDRFSLRKTGSRSDISLLTGLAQTYSFIASMVWIVFTIERLLLLCRYNHLDGDPKEVSPIIDQFLECLWQLMEQFPCAFQYNERSLITIHNHVYSCQYGNFIGNCQRERIELQWVLKPAATKFVLHFCREMCAQEIKSI